MAAARAAFLLMLLASPALAQIPPLALVSLVTQAAERRGIPLPWAMRSQLSKAAGTPTPRAPPGRSG